MAIFFREFEISEPGGHKIHFKHYPNQHDKVVVEEDTMGISVHARSLMLSMVNTVHTFMSENTMNEISIKEGKDS